MGIKWPKTVTTKSSAKTLKNYTVPISSQEIADPGGHRDLVA
jgi:hypothetical protein